MVTAIELISGKPLSDIFGGAGGGTSLGNVVNPTPDAGSHACVDHHLHPFDRVDHDDDDHSQLHLDHHEYHRAHRRRDDNDDSSCPLDHRHDGSRSERDDDNDSIAVSGVALATSP